LGLAQELADAVAHTVQLFADIILWSADVALEKLLQKLASKNIIR